jgi:hypothetical protein
MRPLKIYYSCHSRPAQAGIQKPLKRLDSRFHGKNKSHVSGRNSKVFKLVSFPEMRKIFHSPPANLFAPGMQGSHGINASAF